MKHEVFATNRSNEVEDYLSIVVKPFTVSVFAGNEYPTQFMEVVLDCEDPKFPEERMKVYCRFPEPKLVFWGNGRDGSPKSVTLEVLDKNEVETAIGRLTVYLFWKPNPAVEVVNAKGDKWFRVSYQKKNHNITIWGDVTLLYHFLRSVLRIGE